MQLSWILVGLNFDGSSLDDILNFNGKQETSTFQSLTLPLFSYLWKCRISVGFGRVFSKEKGFKFYLLCLHFFLCNFYSEWCLYTSCTISTTNGVRTSFFYSTVFFLLTIFTSSCAISTAKGICTLPVIHSFLFTINYLPQQSIL